MHVLVSPDNFENSDVRRQARRETRGMDRMRVTGLHLGRRSEQKRMRAAREMKQSRERWCGRREVAYGRGSKGAAGAGKRAAKDQAALLVGEPADGWYKKRNRHRRRKGTEGAFSERLREVECFADKRLGRRGGGWAMRRIRSAWP